MKEIERTTNHDVKAVEYFLRERIAGTPELARAAEFVHFACTSEDINNLAYALMLRDLRAERAAARGGRRDPGGAHARRALRGAADARAHARPAGVADHARQGAGGVRGQRWCASAARSPSVEILGKMNGAVGNYNAHLAAWPGVDWEAIVARRSSSRSASPGTRAPPRSSRTTGSPSCATRSRASNRVLIDFSRDVWGYISLGYFRQRVGRGRGRLVDHAAQGEPDRLRERRGQPGRRERAAPPPRREAADLALAARPHGLDRAAQRRRRRRPLPARVSVAAARASASSRSIARRLDADLDSSWEVLAEAIQTVLRRYGVPDAYEQLKALTRGTRRSTATRCFASSTGCRCRTTRRGGCAR